MLTEAVLAQCDANDGIVDRVVNDPLSCDFSPARDLDHAMCPNDVNADDCFTTTQLKAIEDIYSGPYDSEGVSIYKGKSFGSEVLWPRAVIPHQGNNHRPGQMGLASDYVNFLFYDTDPGVPTTRPDRPSRWRPTPPANRRSTPGGNSTSTTSPPDSATTMRAITDADDPNLTRYLVQEGASC